MLSILRDKLAHEYPGDPEMQLNRLLNEAYASSSRLIDSVAALKQYVLSQDLVPGIRSTR
jgi:hypothetical protein